MKYTSKNFHLHYIPQYKLFVKADFLEDTLIVVDESNEVQAMFSYPTNEPDAEAIKLLGLPFQYVFVSLPVQSLVFIPAEVYQEENHPLYQTFLIDDHVERTQVYTLDNLQITASYQYDLLLYNRWRAIFPHAKFAADFQFILTEVQTYIPMQGTVLGAHFNNTQVELFGFKNGKFLFYNVFDINNVDDLNYFVLTTCQAFDLPIRLHKILISGVNVEHEYSIALSHFANRTEFLQTQVDLYADDEDIAKEANKFNIIATALLCVS
ncbi:DUF3822 family protein [Sphingobacterium gobiense]|uniref:DUF3822 domain-containing protein n=1 Tax=Sphingobacterium gobiense TaxID=1382456 RepID=A0A2S9JSP7_9SPHI|nr:DUF3822 family protein [Sphingobacterium gobiense]PRD56274.1 hypothetical protein C5749_03130 [Sphingobacterium gobiense]